MIRIPCLIIGYLIGCLQTAYITGRLKANVDIRKLGSGNAGTTNVARELGFSTGLLVLSADILKAVLAFLLCGALFAFTGTDRLILGLYAGLGVILGHNFPVFLKFKGGKGIASSLGVMICVDWRAALLIILIGIALIALTRFISLGSLVMMILFPISMIFLGKDAECVILAFILTALAAFQHRGNIMRLLNGTERKFSFIRRGKP